MPRKRFNAAEKDLISQLDIGDTMEWQNVTQWHPGQFAGQLERDADGWDSVLVIHTGRPAGIVRTGDEVKVSPGHIRSS